MKLKKLTFLAAFFLTVHSYGQVFVSPEGNDSNSGSIESPLKTLNEALSRIGDSESGTILLREGVYVLDRELVIDRSNLTIASYNGEKVELSGIVPLELKWKKAGKGMMWKAFCDADIDQLLAGGKKKILARYPDWTEGEFFNGTAEDAVSPERIASWSNPVSGIINTMHKGRWGSMHYRITGVKDGKLQYEGGWQVTRSSEFHKSLTYVENIREELDSPGEWFRDAGENVLYYIPEEGEDVRKMNFSYASTISLLSICGSADKPVRNVTVSGIKFTGTRKSVLEPYDTLLRSDWGIYRGAAVFLDGTEDCRISGCEFSGLGGNAIFINGYARRDSVLSNHIHDIGSSAICLIGSTSAVRSGSYGYTNYVRYEDMDIVPGPASVSYPKECLVEDNLIHNIGQVEKQVAGVGIQVAALISVRHNSIYEVPRAGINIGDGAFGGHIIEYNDVFDTVMETGDHGAFNSWGRDRFWIPNRKLMDSFVSEHPELILSDAIYTTTIRFNRFRCDRSWDIDLDDGSSNYHIYGNLCLNGGIKLREGFFRKVENNITINNSLHPHVWFAESHDIVRRNLFMLDYRAVSPRGWGEELDFNFFSKEEYLGYVREKGTDRNSVSGKLKFADESAGDYTPQEDCLAYSIGFEKIPMNSFGVINPYFKSIAKKPVFPKAVLLERDNDTENYSWTGATIRSVEGLGDQSAFGLPQAYGAVVLAVEEGSIAAKAGLCEGDVIWTFNSVPVKDAPSLLQTTAMLPKHREARITYYRNQTEMQTLLFR